MKVLLLRGAEERAASVPVAEHAPLNYCSTLPIFLLRWVERNAHICLFPGKKCKSLVSAYSPDSSQHPW